MTLFVFDVQKKIIIKKTAVLLALGDEKKKSHPVISANNGGKETPNKCSRPYLPLFC